MSIKNQTYSPEWEYKGEKFNPDFPINHYGFIYKIVYDNDMVYLGKKSFWKTKTLQPLKGYKRKRRSMVESDWRTYKGSTKEIPDDVNLIYKEILMFADSKVHLTYLETKTLLENKVPLNDKFYNKNVLGKFYDNVDRRVGEWIKWYEKGIDSE